MGGAWSATSFSRRRMWVLGFAIALVASTLVAGVGGDVVNGDGWPNVGRFWSAMFRPELAPDFLSLTVTSAATTLSFAALGTVLSLLIGLAFAPVLASRTWEGDGRRTVPQRVLAGVLQRMARGMGVVPRGVNEVVWALLLTEVFGAAPLVAVLAIGIPFGAVTAAVFADTIDESDARPYRQLRRHGTGRLAALVYGVGPIARADLISYGWYRFECAIRAAAVLGIVGAGGLGYEINLSFDSLRYHEMWTMIWALVVIAAGADALSAAMRRRQASSMCRCGDLRVPVAAAARQRAPSAPATGWRRWGWVGAVAVTVIASWWWVRLDPSLAWEPRRVDLATRLAADLLPPRLGPGGWSALTAACVETIAMSFLAIALSVGLGIVLATLGARSANGELPTGRSPRAAASWAGRASLRLVALIARAVPPPVWVFVAALVLFPGIWPGVIALGLYNAGVMARLFAESLEDVDPRPAELLRAAGATRAQAFFYATLPILSPRLVALSVYRWEVITRETVIVGVVGAAGIGRLIKDDLVARDFAALTTSLAALVVLTALASAAGSRARTALR